MCRVILYRVIMSTTKYQSSSISKNVILYMIVHIVGSTLTLLHHLYLVIFWRPATPSIATDDPLYDPYVLFWTGMFMGIYLYAAPMPVFFVTLDRCIALKFPIQYNNKFVRRRMPIITTIVTVLWCAAIVIFFLLELPLDLTNVKFCESATCMLLKYHGAPQQYMKYAVSVMNAVCTVYFFYALRTFNTFDGARKIFTAKNRIVIVTSVSEFLLNIFPLVFATVYLNVAKQSSAIILGNYGMLLFTIDAVICSIFYVRIYLRKNTQVAVINKGHGVNTIQRHMRMFPTASTTTSLHQKTATTRL
ncbi:hypothetical protein Ddc_22813 [Ditylenchus destructor]|nr:hypothetical protein Ddc_22813 [Ditylenchus destructor]